MPGRRDALLMISAVALLAAVTIGWGERIGVNNGAGWDGQAYVSWARDFPGAMRSGFTVYQSKRVVPSAIVYGALRALGSPRTVRRDGRRVQRARPAVERRAPRGVVRAGRRARDPRLATRVRAARRVGPCPITAIALTIALSIDTESRVIVGLWPFVIVAVVDAVAWTPRSAAIAAALGLAWSKLWWHLGYDRAIDAFDWPNLRYTMHDGPRASDATHLAHGIAAVITGVVLALALRRRPTGRR